MESRDPVTPERAAVKQATESLRSLGFPLNDAVLLAVYLLTPIKSKTVQA